MTAQPRGVEDHVQCARCGSSMMWEDCWSCGGEGEEYGLDEIDPMWYGPEDHRACNWCCGSGGAWICLSDADWCSAHPRPGRATTPRDTVERFTVTTP